MLKLLSAGLFGLLFFGLNASAEGVRIEIETDRDGVRIQIETDSSDMEDVFFGRDSSDRSDPLPPLADKTARGYRDMWMGGWAGPDCSGNPECKATCDDIYRTSLGRKKCIRGLSTTAVGKINEVVEVLKSQSQRQIEQLQNMNLQALELLLSLDYEPLKEVVARGSFAANKRLATWLAGNREVTEIVASADSDFEILKDLFGSSESAIIASLNKSIDSGDSFIEIALEEGNDAALEWLHDFFGDECEGEDKYEKCVFKRYYCELSLSDGFEEDYFDYGFFEDILDAVWRSTDRRMRRTGGRKMC